MSGANNDIVYMSFNNNNPQQQQQQRIHWDEAISKPDLTFFITYAEVNGKWSYAEFISTHDKNLCYKLPDDLDDMMKQKLAKISIYLDFSASKSVWYHIKGFDADEDCVMYAELPRDSFGIQLTG